MTAQTKQEIANCQGLFPAKYVAAHYGITVSRVNQIWFRVEAEPQPDGIIPDIYVPLEESPLLPIEVEHFHSLGHSPAGIAQILGIDEHLVRITLANLGVIFPRITHKGGPRKNESIDFANPDLR